VVGGPQVGAGGVQAGVGRREGVGGGAVGERRPQLASRRRALSHLLLVLLHHGELGLQLFQHL
jgi:hypothetical protein